MHVRRAPLRSGACGGPKWRRSLKRSRDLKLVRNSGYFDAAWYRQRYAAILGRKDPARHYLEAGARGDCDPGPEFSSAGYLAANPDVAAQGLNPLLHYERYGKVEGRAGHAVQAVGAPSAGSDYAVILHAYHHGCFEELRGALSAFPAGVDRYVSYPRNSEAHPEAAIAAAFPGCTLIPVDNVGQDVGAFAQVLEAIDGDRYGFYCKLHSKGGDKLPSIWRQALLRGTVGDGARVAQFERVFRDQPDVMLGGARELFLHGPSYEMENGGHLTRLLQQVGLPADAAGQDWGFFAGTFFWMRATVAERFRASLGRSDFSGEAVQRDGQLAHAGERFAGLLARAMGAQVALASCVSLSEPVEVFRDLPEETPRHAVSMMAQLGALQSRWIGRRAEAMAADEVPGLGFSRIPGPDTRAGMRQEDFAIITPTGDRPSAFNRCIQMVTTQTLQPKEWIVVDDGAVPLSEQLELPGWATYVRREPGAGDPPHTLSRNVLAALEHVTADRVLIFEDDDWYSPLYAEFLLPWLDCYDLVGLNLIRYYHLRGSAWKNGHPPAHTAFAQSAFRRGHAWAHLAAVCRTDFPEIREKGIVDRHWWTTFEGSKHLINDHPCLHLGLKGGFGRPGLASGHERREVDYIPDPKAAHLSGILGPDRLGYAGWQTEFRKPYAVYTCLLDGAAGLPAPGAGLRHCDLHAFAAVPGRVSAPWQTVPLDERFATVALTTAKPMSLPHLYFPDYEWSIWCPPGRVPDEDLERLVARAIEARADLATAGEVIVRRHNLPSVARAMTAWWRAQRAGEVAGPGLATAAAAEGVSLLRL